MTVMQKESVAGRLVDGLNTASAVYTVASWKEETGSEGREEKMRGVILPFEYL